MKYLRKFQEGLVSRVPDFNPDGYEQWKRDQMRLFNQESFGLIRDIEQFLNADIRRRLEDRFASNWFREAVPQQIYRDAHSRAAEKTHERDDGIEVDWWNALYLIDYKKIMQHAGGEVWAQLFERTYMLPSDSKKSWRQKLDWLDQLNKVRNKVAHNDAVSEEEFGFLQILHSHLELGNGATE